MAYIAVDGMSIESSAEPFTITTASQNNAKIDGKGIYAGPIVVSYSPGATQNGLNLVNPVVLTINPITESIKANNLSVIVEGDKGEIPGVFVNSNTGATSTLTIKAEIKKANQDFVEVN